MPPSSPQPNPPPSPDNTMMILMKVVELTEAMGEIDKTATRLDEKIINVVDSLKRGRERMDKIDLEMKNMDEKKIQPLQAKVTKLWVIYGLIMAGVTVGVGFMVNKFLELASQLPNGASP